jgi:hypothetical protein
MNPLIIVLIILVLVIIVMLVINAKSKPSVVHKILIKKGCTAQYIKICSPTHQLDLDSITVVNNKGTPIIFNTIDDAFVTVDDLGMNGIVYLVNMCNVVNMHEVILSKNDVSDVAKHAMTITLYDGNMSLVWKHTILSNSDKDNIIKVGDALYENHDVTDELAEKYVATLLHES